MKSLIFPTVVALCAATCCFDTYAQENTALASRNIERAAAILDAAWQHSLSGDADNLVLADSYDTLSGDRYGIADVWPYTAAIEAHCSLLEALEAVREKEPLLYEENHDRFTERLELLIKNMDWYRGNLRLSSYACNKEWQPYAVPRGSAPGKANVSGILNVYDDQMWIARELIRAYRLTGNEEWLETATHLTDYVLAGWDCWRDADGKEYGGITWGPGYNSKHACSNAPIIQSLVWLAEIYSDTDMPISTDDNTTPRLRRDAACRVESAETTYYYRDENNNIAFEEVQRSDLYLDFAVRIYDWQKENLANGNGVYYDMMGADNTIKVSRGYRQHVDCGGRTGTFFSYNTGTMIAGAASLLSYLSSTQSSLSAQSSLSTQSSLSAQSSLSTQSSLTTQSSLSAQSSLSTQSSLSAQSSLSTHLSDMSDKDGLSAQLKADLTQSTRASISNFAKYVRARKSYEFNTDATAESGFNTWFNDVLLRAMADAEPWSDNTSPATALDSQQTNLDYAWDNYNRDNSLPIHLLDGWGTETRSKAFHQFAFASEYAILAKRHAGSSDSGVSRILPDSDGFRSDSDGSTGKSGIYDLQGRELPAGTTPTGLYIRNGRLIHP